LAEFDFQNPDYSAVLAKRAEVLKEIREDAEKLQALKVYYKDHIADFINDWGMTFDPRNVDVGLPSTIPFVLFDKQREWVDWVYGKWRERSDGVTEKSRDMGVSWLSVAIAASIWLFHPGVVIGFGSRKEEYVDKLDSPKSLFWKARQFIELLPREFRPESYDDPFMKIINHDNGSYIVGEAGNNIGRGDRSSIYFVDEAAFIEQQQSVDAALSQTSNCKIFVSTPNGNGNEFYQKRHSGKYPVFSFHWRDDPRKDEDWYRDQQNTLDPIVLAQEVDIDYNASTTDAWIPGEDMEEAQGYGVADLEPIGPLVIGVDAAHYGDDESVVSPRQGRIAYDQLTFRKTDGVRLAGEVTEYIDQSPIPVAGVVIELDGPGVSCFDQLKAGKYAHLVHGVHTGSRLSDTKNYNLRAKMYRKFRDWLQEKPVRVPADKTLKAQACSVKYGYKDGTLLLHSKKQMKKDGVKSPDRADALALTFAVDEKTLLAKPRSAPKVKMGRSPRRVIR